MERPFQLYTQKNSKHLEKMVLAFYLYIKEIQNISCACVYSFLYFEINKKGLHTFSMFL